MVLGSKRVYVYASHRSLGPWLILFTGTDISCKFQGIREDRVMMDLGAAFCTEGMKHS